MCALRVCVAQQIELNLVREVRLSACGERIPRDGRIPVVGSPKKHACRFENFKLQTCGCLSVCAAQHIMLFCSLDVPNAAI